MTEVSVRFRVLVGAVGVVVLAVVAQAAETDRNVHHTVRFTSESGSPLDIRTMRFSPDGSILAVSVSYKGMSLIRTQDGETVAEHKASPFSITYSRDGSRMFLISETNRELLDATSRTPIQFKVGSEPGYLGIRVESRNGKLLVSELLSGGPAERSGKIKLGNELVGIGEGKTGTSQRVVGFSDRQATELIRGIAGTYLRIEFIPKGQFTPIEVTLRREAMQQDRGESTFVPFRSDDAEENLAWCMADNLHTLSSAYTGKVVSVLQMEDVERVGQYALSPDSKTFAVLANRRAGEGAAIELFAVASRERLGCVAFPQESWYQIAFSGDSSKLLIGTWDTVEVLDVKSRSFLPPLTLGWERPTPTEKVEAEPEPRRGGSAAAVVQAAADRNAFGGASDVEQRHSPQRLVTCLACSARNIVATGDPFGQVTLWNLSTGNLLARMPWTEQKKVETCQFSPEWKWLTYYVDGVLHIVDISKIGDVESGKK